MPEKPDLITNYDQVVENVLRFNQELRGSVGLQGRLAQFRGWYYIPEMDAVGPSKFIGYQGLTAETYLVIAKRGVGYVDGRVTEPHLSAWFKPLEVNTPEYRRVREKVTNLLEGFRKSPNKRARFNVPR